MPKLIPMRANVAFDRNGRTVSAGDLMEVSPLEALALNYKKKASFLTPAEAAASKSSQRLYQRRDMEAEDSSAAAPEASGRGRRHKRRDLEAADSEG
jgi:hypothetical protein